MTQKSPRTVDDDMPPIPQFHFAKGKTDIEQKENEQELAACSDVEFVDDEKSSPNKTPRSLKPKKKMDRKSSTHKTSGRKEGSLKAAGKAAPQMSDTIVQADVVFSTEVRRSLQLDLALLSHKREMGGHKVFTIKQFLHDAVTSWFDSSRPSEAEQESRILQMQFPETDTYDALNNRIKQNLKRQLKTLKHEREMSNHPVNTIIAFTEEALIEWLLQQKDFSVGDRKKHQSNLAA